MSLVTSYQTFWGNALQGIFITWKHDRSTVTDATVLTSAVMQAVVDVNMYALTKDHDS